VRHRAGIGESEAGEELVGADVPPGGLQAVEQPFRQRRLAAAAPSVDRDQRSAAAGRLDAADPRGQRIEEIAREVLRRARATIEARGRQLRPLSCDSRR
jgi:hypothetical protein